MKKILLIIILFCSCNKPDESKSKLDNNIVHNINDKYINVGVGIIKNDTFQKQIISNGKIEAILKAKLHFKVNNRLHKTYFKNGQKINQGQIIGVLENTLLANELEKTKIDLQKAKIKLKEEKINYGLNNSDSELNNEEIIKTLRIKSGELEAQNMLERANIMYNQTVLVAPFSGVMANLEFKQGDYISSNDVFCTLVNYNNTQITFFVVESEFPFIKIGNKIKISTLDSSKNDIDGFISEINPIVEENGFIQVKAKIDKRNGNLIDGMNARVYINQPIDNVIVIPKEALVLRSNKEVVFTLKNNRAKWNYVDVIDENLNNYAIKKGLKAGDTIIISGNMNLSHDTKVNATFIPQLKDSNDKVFN